MDSGAEPFSRRLWLYARWSVGLTALFLLTYGGTNWLAAHQARRFHLYWDWELAIPFVPWMIWIYLSVQGYFLLPLFILRCAEIQRFGRAFAAMTICAGLIHLALPAEPGWPRPIVVAGYPVYASFFALDAPHNLMPSLHVGYSLLTCLAVWGRASLGVKLIAGIWLLLLIASVFLVHQHHALDAAGGIALAILCHWLVRRGEPRTV